MEYITIQNIDGHVMLSLYNTFTVYDRPGNSLTLLFVIFTILYTRYFNRNIQISSS